MTVLNTILAIMLAATSWLLKLILLATWTSLRWLSWFVWPAWLLAGVFLAITLFASTPAKASWLSSWFGPDKKAEAANQALQRAAQIAADAANIQARQQGQLLAAVEALSNERTHLAGHLHQLGTLAAKDSAWAAALHTAGPVLVAVAVLALGCAAIWMLTRTSDRDAALAAVLVEELAGTGPGVLTSPVRHEALIGSASTRTRGLKYEDTDTFPEEQEMPF
jgi:hypothetical protein